MIALGIWLQKKIIPSSTTFLTFLPKLFAFIIFYQETCMALYCKFGTVLTPVKSWFDAR